MSMGEHSEIDLLYLNRCRFITAGGSITAALIPGIVEINPKKKLKKNSRIEPLDPCTLLFDATYVRNRI